MIEIYTSPADGLGERLKGLLGKRVKGPYEILRGENGKPYIHGDPVCFSISHSKDKGVIVLSDAPVGADLEVFGSGIKAGIVSRWDERERAEIVCEKEFLKHWTAREAYVKLYGGSVVKMWKRIGFFGGNLFVDGDIRDVTLRFYEFYFGIAAVCSEKRKTF